MSLTGKKFDDQKAQLDLVPLAAVEGIARALMYGAGKYGKNNYKGGLEWSRIAAALLRHTFAWLSGEELDKESGLNHLDHMGACVAMLAYYKKHSVGSDDR